MAMFLWWLKRQLRSTRPAERRKAATRLGEARPPAAVELLEPLLKDQAELVRSAAAEALGKIGNPGAFDALFRAFVNIERADDPTRVAVGKALLSTKSVAEQLVRNIEDKDVTVRRVAAYLLGGVADRKTAPALHSLLTDSDSRVSGSAAVSLGLLGDARALMPLVDVVASADSSTRSLALEAVKRIGAGDIHLLLQTLKEGSPKQRGAAAQMLGTLRDPRAVGPLISQLVQDEDSDSMAGAAIGLSMLDAKREVVDRLKNVPSERRAEVAKLLSVISLEWATDMSQFY